MKKYLNTNHLIRNDMHEAEHYLRNPETPNSLYIQYQERRRRLFFNREQNAIGIVAPGKRTRGYHFSDWNGIEKIFWPAPAEDPAEANRRLIRKFQHEAAKAGFTSPFIRKIQHADYSKDLYKNGITTGTRIDGQIITLEAVRKWCGETIYRSRTARRTIQYNSTSGATTVRSGWKSTTRMTATIRPET